jgi:hypothetical protein
VLPNVKSPPVDSVTGLLNRTMLKITQGNTGIAASRRIATPRRTRSRVTRLRAPTTSGSATIGK